jgi:Fe-S-cluster containining protein
VPIALPAEFNDLPTAYFVSEMQPDGLCPKSRLILEQTNCDISRVVALRCDTACSFLKKKTPELAVNTKAKLTEAIKSHKYNVKAIANNSPTLGKLIRNGKERSFK